MATNMISCYLMIVVILMGTLNLVISTPMHGLIQISIAEDERMTQFIRRVEETLMFPIHNIEKDLAVTTQGRIKNFNEFLHDAVNNGYITPEVATNLNFMKDKFELFKTIASKIVGQRSCDHSVLLLMLSLRETAVNSPLLIAIYDAMALHLNTKCLLDTVGNIPRPSGNLKMSVENYLVGLNNKMVHANEYPEIITDSNKYRQFNLDDAIKQNGPLWATLSWLGISAESPERLVADFAEECRQYTSKLGNIWMPNSLFHQFVNRPDLEFQQYNNMMLSQLPESRYADICSRLIESAMA